MVPFPRYIFGLHDSGGEKLMLDAGKPGWIVVTAKATDAPGDYTGMANAGLGVIVRLNYGYGSQGTLPPSSQYDAFAQQCAQFVAGSRGAGIWVIGNETNLAAERPGNTGGNDGEVITPDKYAACFAKCRAAILGVPGHAGDYIAPAPPGPWNPQTMYPGNPGGDWVKYYQDILALLVKMGAPPSALALHTYTHGFDAGLVASEDRMAPAYPNYHYHLRAYQDFMSVVPGSLRGLPVLITETQPADPGWWQNRNIGWIQAAYAEINAWNAQPGNQAVQALCLFRWERGDDRWSICDKPALLDDFRAALQNDYPVHKPSTQPSPTPPVEHPKPVATTTGWCPIAIKRPIIEENYDAGRSGQKVRAVVLHIAAGPMSAVFNTFCNPAPPTSAHFCVGKDGTIEQYVSIDDTAYGNGLRWSNGEWHNPRGVLVTPSWQDLVPGSNPNLYTVSIEHEGHPEDVWTPQMYEANNRLLQWIAQEVGLTYVPHRTLIGHFEINPVDRPNCPGPNVDYTRIAADANLAVESPERLEMLRAVAREASLLPINTGSALFRYAQSNHLGYPQTDEFEYPARGSIYVGQVFNLGIVYVEKGHWDALHWTQKRSAEDLPPNPLDADAIEAALQRAWMPVNVESALYKFAQARQLGYPQTDEFAFTLAGESYIGQVYTAAFVYAPQSDFGKIRLIEKAQAGAIPFEVPGMMAEERPAPPPPPVRRKAPSRKSTRPKAARRRTAKKAPSRKTVKKTRAKATTKTAGKKTAGEPVRKKATRKTARRK